jgi:hypothetical protein
MTFRCSFIASFPPLARSALCSLLFISSVCTNCTAWAKLPPQQESASQEAKRLPLDPLTPEERATAERAARADKRVKDLLGEGNIRLISVELLAMKVEKPSEEARPTRQAEVVLFRPERDIGVRVAVNLERNVVEDANRLSGTQVPLNADDLAEAFELAMKNDELVKVLGPAAGSYRLEIRPGERTLERSEYGVTGLRVRGTTAKDPCFRDRCMQLFFRKGNSFLSEPLVTVDLTARKVTLERRKP